MNFAIAVGTQGKFVGYVENTPMLFEFPGANAQESGDAVTSFVNALDTGDLGGGSDWLLANLPFDPLDPASVAMDRAAADTIMNLIASCDGFEMAGVEIAVDALAVRMGWAACDTVGDAIAEGSGELAAELLAVIMV